MGNGIKANRLWVGGGFEFVANVIDGANAQVVR